MNSLTQKTCRQDTKRRHKYKGATGASNIGFTASLNPLEDLSLDELAEFLRWQRAQTGDTAEEFYRKGRRHRNAIFLRWCAALAENGAYICVKILSAHPLESVED